MSGAVSAAGPRAFWRRAPRPRSGRLAGALVPFLCLAPLVLLLLACFVWPLLQLAAGSFHPHSETGQGAGWTLANYRHLLDPFYLGALWRTLRLSLIVSAICAVLAYPVAWYLAGLRPAAQAYLLTIYVAPWLVNVAVKAFGWMLLLDRHGPVNAVLQALGLTDAPLRLVFNEVGVVIGLVHAHFIFVLLPLWAALSALDRKLIWAAASLGASGPRILWEVVLPVTLPALMSGIIINFMLNVGAFATPALLGGARLQLISYLVYRIDLVELNWELGAALAMLILAVTAALVIAARRVGGTA